MTFERAFGRVLAETINDRVFTPTSTRGAAARGGSLLRLGPGGCGSGMYESCSSCHEQADTEEPDRRGDVPELPSCDGARRPHLVRK